ncbi:hypothetical protein [Litchfieldia alkalitelluris]|uniref:hypothetical protein n=1 Tax=Litchfieldia alkalitelluris TaxID=304268 RepID=UPI000996BE12|nr:hypothetical protein [Litchfieldia alkalitelluris]
MEFEEYWQQIYEYDNKINSLISSYWGQYSHMGTWQFWFVVSLLVMPIILLYFLVDRKRIFEVLFYGYTVHILWSYTIIALNRHNLFIHKYFLTPVLPYSITVSASALPVGFLLLYQYCTNHKRNFYLFTVLFSIVFAFGFASIEELLGFIELRKGMSKFHLLLIDIIVSIIAYWLTKIVLKLKENDM